MSCSSDCRQRTRRRIGLEREVREHEIGAAGDLVTGRDQRLAPVAERGAADACESDQGPEAGAKGGRSSVVHRGSPRRSIGSRSRSSSGWPEQGAAIPGHESLRPSRRFRSSLAWHRAAMARHRPFQSLRSDQAPGQVRAEEPQRVGPGATRHVGQAHVQPRQVLDPAVLRKRVDQVDPFQVDDRKLRRSAIRVADQEQVGRLQVAVRDRSLVHVPQEPGQGQRQPPHPDPLLGGLQSGQHPLDVVGERDALPPP